MAGKKPAKVAHRGGVARPEETSAGKLVMLTGSGHRVSKNISGLADCGIRMTGWRYGEERDVTCPSCSPEPEE